MVALLVCEKRRCTVCGTIPFFRLPPPPPAFLLFACASLRFSSRFFLFSLARLSFSRAASWTRRVSSRRLSTCALGAKSGRGRGVRGGVMVRWGHLVIKLVRRICVRRSRQASAARSVAAPPLCCSGHGLCVTRDNTEGRRASVVVCLVLSE